MSLFDINAVVFHFDDFFSINDYIILNTCFIDVLQKIPSSQIDLHLLKYLNTNVTVAVR